MIHPRDIFNYVFDIFISLKYNYCTDNFYYLVEVTIPQFLSTIMENEKSNFLSPHYPCVIVSKLTDNIIRATIESFINSNDEMLWLKMYHIIPKLNIQEIYEILYRNK